MSLEEAITKKNAEAMAADGIRKKETSESNVKTTDTDENPLDSRGDTALSRNSNVSSDKDIKTLSENQIGREDGQRISRSRNFGHKGFDP